MEQFPSSEREQYGFPSGRIRSVHTNLYKIKNLRKVLVWTLEWSRRKFNPYRARDFSLELFIKMFTNWVWE